MAPFIFIVVGMVTLVFTLFPIKATVWLEERLLVTLYMFPVFLSVIFVPTETDGVSVSSWGRVISQAAVWLLEPVVTVGCDPELGNCLSSRYTTNSTGVCFYAFFCNCCRFGDYTVIPGVLAGSRNFSYIFFAVTSCAVMALAADCFAGSSGIDSPVGTVVVTQSCDCLSPCFATGIAGKGFYTLISTGRLSGNCTIIPGMTGSRNFSYIFLLSHRVQ